jgi:hypothetical protein
MVLADYLSWIESSRRKAAFSSSILTKSFYLAFYFIEELRICRQLGDDLRSLFDLLC